MKYYNDKISNLILVIQQITSTLEKSRVIRWNPGDAYFFRLAQYWGIEYLDKHPDASDFTQYLDDIDKFTKSKLEEIEAAAHGKFKDLSEHPGATVDDSTTNKHHKTISFADNLKSDIKSKYHANESFKSQNKTAQKYLVSYIIDERSLDNAVVRLSNTDKINSGTFRSKLSKLYPDAMYIRILSWSKIID